jgi:P27 family predicted phage terminase small subunit
MRGRVPRPREERIREGKTRNLPEQVLVNGRAEVAEVLEPPVELRKDARAWWDRVVPALAEAGLLERVDVYIVAMAATAWGEWVGATRVIGEFGQYQIGSVGNIVPHAATKVQRDALASFERLVGHLALSPTARARLGLAHLHGRALMKEMDDAIGSRDDDLLADADVIEEEDLDTVGLPGL